MNCCQDIAEKLLQFRDGDLPPKDEEFLRQHLQHCPACLTLLNGYDEVVEILERLKPVNMPADLCERMKKCLHDELKKDDLPTDCAEPQAGSPDAAGESGE